MAVLKVTILCNFLGGPPAGFSESWVLNAGESQFQTRAIDLGNLRRGCLSKSWYVQGVRAAKLVIKQHVAPLTGLYIGQELVQLPCSGFGVNATGQQGVTDTPWTAVFVKMGTQSPTGHVGRPRLQQMRGVPDDLWEDAKFNKGRAGQVFSQFLGVVSSVQSDLAAGHPWIGGTQTAGEAPNNALYISQCIDRASSRRIGRPFGLLRGRRSVTQEG